MKILLMATATSLALSSAVIGYAYHQKKQFYPSVVYITKSNPSMGVLYIQAFVLVLLMGKLMEKIFFGRLRDAETEHLMERMWYAVTETCLAFTVFRDDLTPKFMAMFTLLLFLKCFHWLAEDRVDYMERSPMISVLFHTRVIALQTFLGMMDLYLMYVAGQSVITLGPSVQMVFGFEYAILLTAVIMTLMKYILHTIDLTSENPWENKAVYLLYSELILGFFRVVLYMAFFIILTKFHTFPLFALRPTYLAIRSFKKALRDVIMSRRAIRNMNTLYPNATEEELQTGDNVCIICREEMTTTSKKLPCNHIFHINCLRSWFQRQQTCPTCRMDVLRMPTPAVRPRPEPAQPQPPPQPQPDGPQMPNGPGQFPGFNMWMGGVPPQLVQPQAPGGVPPVSTSATSTTTSAQAANAPPAFVFPGMPGAHMAPGMPGASMAAGMPPPPFMSGMMPMTPHMFSPFGMPTFDYPRPPPDLSNISDEALQDMEGQERSNIEARLQWLKDVQTLLDTAMLMINQYNDVAATTNLARISVAPSTVFPPTTLSSSVTVTLSSTSSSSPSSTERRTITTTIPSSLQRQASQSSTANIDATTKTTSSVTWQREHEQEKENNPFTQLLSEPSSEASLQTASDEAAGATGYTSPPDEYIPPWEDPQQEEIVDGLHELRHRRLQRFENKPETETPVVTAGWMTTTTNTATISDDHHQLHEGGSKSGSN